MSLFQNLVEITNSSWITELHIHLRHDRDKPSYLALQILSLLIVILLIYNFGERKLFRSSQNVVNLIPGPVGLPLIGNLLEVLTVNDIIAKLGSLAEQYQPYYRLRIGSKPVIVLTSAEAVEKLLSSSEDGHLVKAQEYEALADYFDGGLVTSEGEKWRVRRKLFSPLFNYKCFPHFLEVFNKHSKQLMHDLELTFKDGKAKPIQNPIYESLLKIICETAMGVEFDDSPDGFDKFFEEAERTKEYIWFKVSRPWMQIKWIWKLHPFRKVYEENQKYIKDYISQIIRESRTVNSQKTPITDTIRNKTVMDAMLEKGLEDFEIREEAHTMISAGHETSGAALQFTLMFLALHPEHQKICQEEVDKIINDNTKCPNGDFTMSALSELKHTERCIKEALRLYPIAYMFARKLKSPLQMSKNITFPVGTTCVVFPSDLHKSSKYFFNPEKFDPSRFTPENTTARHPFCYIPFSKGRRDCLGHKFSTVQMKLVAARILHHFELSTVDNLKDVPLDTSIVLTPVRGYNFILKMRNPIPYPKM